MKRTVSIVLSVLFMLTVSSTAFGEEDKGSMMGGKGMMKQGKKMGMPSMHGMMKMMMSKTLAATSDGGVVVMVGNKLLKYDKDLNLEKEAEVNIDMEAMQKMMMDMKEKCPMSKEMMKKGSMMGAGAEGSAESGEASGQKSHH